MTSACLAVSWLVLVGTSVLESEPCKISPCAIYSIRSSELVVFDMLLAFNFLQLVSDSSQDHEIFMSHRFFLCQFLRLGVE